MNAIRVKLLPPLPSPLCAPASPVLPFLAWEQGAVVEAYELYYDHAHPGRLDRGWDSHVWERPFEVFGSTPEVSIAELTCSVRTAV
jgi:hypothetical protein